MLWAKNRIWGGAIWKDCEATGYHKDTPAWLAVWLLIIVDNILHIIMNGIALNFLI